MFDSGLDVDYKNSEEKTYNENRFEFDYQKRLFKVRFKEFMNFAKDLELIMAKNNNLNRPRLDTIKSEITSCEDHITHSAMKCTFADPSGTIDKVLNERKTYNFRTFTKPDFLKSYHLQLTIEMLEKDSGYLRLILDRKENNKKLTFIGVNLEKKVYDDMNNYIYIKKLTDDHKHLPRIGEFS